MTRRRVVVRVAVDVDGTLWTVHAALDGSGVSLTGAVLTVAGPANGSPFMLYADRQRRVMTTEQRVPVDAMWAAMKALREGPIADRLYPPSAPLEVGVPS